MSPSMTCTTNGEGSYSRDYMEKLFVVDLGERGVGQGWEGGSTGSSGGSWTKGADRRARLSINVEWEE